MNQSRTILYFGLLFLLATLNRKAGANIQFVTDDDDEKDDAAVPNKSSRSFSETNSVDDSNTENVNNYDKFNVYEDRDYYPDTDEEVEKKSQTNSEIQQASRSLSEKPIRTAAPEITVSKQKLIMEMKKDLLESNRLYLIMLCSIIAAGCLFISFSIFYLARKIIKFSREKSDIVSAEEGKQLSKR
ncbi:hypothetical protein XELAEV_18022824mg [Xenopus laevis]|uniref:Uncharacterized protein n=1 Tax=Xenopus laevis TaxID=8355 RepID=A0A974D2Z5_XENLA|nr:hypothetical protein XELAEV_18022824mg [Xenopus laevis]